MLRPSEGETERDRDRIVNLSEAVFAIAIALLILDIRVPDIPEKMVASQLPDALLSLWPKYLGYVLSFVGISAFWLIHQSIFLRRGLTIPAIFLLSIAVSFLSVGVAIWMWVIMLVLDALVIRKRFR